MAELSSYNPYQRKTKLSVFNREHNHKQQYTNRDTGLTGITEGRIASML